MKKLLVSLTLLLSICSVDAMGWFWRKKPAEEIKPEATSLEISKTEETEEVSDEPESEEIESEAQETEFTVPAAEALALPQSWLARQKEEALIQAITQGDIERVKQIIAEKSVDVTKPVKSIFQAGKTPLEIANEANASNKEEIVKLLKDAAGIKETEVAPTAQERILMWLPTREERPTGEEVEGVSRLFREPVVLKPTAKPAPPVQPRVIDSPILRTPVQHIQPRSERLQELLRTTEPRPLSPALSVELESEKIETLSPIPTRAAGPAALRPLPTPPAARPVRVWPSTPAPKPVEVKIEVERKARPLPTPPLKAAPRVQEVQVEVTPKAARPLPATPVRPVGRRPLPDLPKIKS